MDSARYYSGLTLDEFLKGMADQDRAAFVRSQEASEKMAQAPERQREMSGSSIHLYAAAEAWCIDTKVNLPVATALAKVAGNIDLRCHTREASRDLGVERIPTFILYDADFLEIGRWVERPQPVKTAMGKAATREEKLLTWNPYLTGAFRIDTLAELLGIATKLDA
ncbi:MAG: thioredoxin family protein [Bacillota bacterium]|nr:thioredoxin family protein [Bacillota bacterium]